MRSTVRLMPVVRYLVRVRVRVRVTVTVTVRVRVRVTARVRVSVSVRVRVRVRVTVTVGVGVRVGVRLLRAEELPPHRVLHLHVQHADGGPEHAAAVAGHMQRARVVVVPRLASPLEHTAHLVRVRVRVS